MDIGKAIGQEHMKNSQWVILLQQFPDNEHAFNQACLSLLNLYHYAKKAPFRYGCQMVKFSPDIPIFAKYNRVYNAVMYMSVHHELLNDQLPYMVYNELRTILDDNNEPLYTNLNVYDTIRLPYLFNL